MRATPVPRWIAALVLSGATACSAILELPEKDPRSKAQDANVVDAEFTEVKDKKAG